MKKAISKIILIFFLLVVYIYVCNITLLPSSYILLQGENLNIYTLLGITVQEKNMQNTLQTASNISTQTTLQTASSINEKQIEQVGKIDLSLSLFKLFNVKNISVNVIPKTTVVPVGRAIRNEIIY